jgi:hypothetical protein
VAVAPVAAKAGLGRVAADAGAVPNSSMAPPIRPAATAVNSNLRMFLSFDMCPLNAYAAEKFRPPIKFGLIIYLEYHLDWL